MNIQELDAYNLDDAVKFNDRLNPRLWDKSEHLRDDVRAQLLLIAEDFREFLGVKDLDLKDITISGSNAAYTYTPNSDIDLHLVVAMPDDPVYRELFDAKKFQYNETHNIKIGGYDVELYVQAADQPHYSQGIYSLLNNDWIQVPKRARATVDDASTKNKFETLGHQIEAAIKSGDRKRLDVMAEKIKRMRQAGLEQHGEFGPENLAFKMLRSQGVLQKLHDARAEARSQELSLKEQPAQPRFTWGFQVDEGSAGLMPVTLTPDGVSPSTKMIVSDVNDHPSDEEILQDFIDFCAKELKIDALPTIKLRRDPQWPVVHKTFGRYRNDLEMLEVAWGQRHIMDVLRTVAHELTHRHQHERDGEKMDATAGETGSPWENEANARAGILMRDYARLHPEYFEAGTAEELHVDEGLRTNAAAAAVVAALSGAAPAQAQVQDIIGAVRDIGSIALAAKKITRAGLNAEAQQELNNYLSVSGDRNSRNLSVIYQLQQRLEQQAEQPQGQPLPGYTQQADPPTNESASGYIPTKKQARDPRFSTALTVDIKPGQLGKEANKLKLKTNSQGEPQQLRANGLFENLFKEYKQYKKSDEDYSPDAPPGPEFKPTMPRGTVRVDVSDMYDWYKLGKKIADLKSVKPGEFGKGPPSTIVSFGDEDTEHKYIKDLENLGLSTTDIDPMDPDQPVGLPRQSVDPTYNVDEQQLDEVKMSPSALKKFADSPAAKGILVGFEAEMIVPDVRVEEEHGDMEPDYEADERCTSIQQVIEFFEYDEYGYGLSGRDAEKLQEKLDELYFEWHDDQMMRDFREEAEDLIKKVIIDEKDWVQEDEVRKQLDMMEITGADQEAVLKAGSMAPRFNSTAEQQAYMAEHPEYEKYVEALEEAEGLLDDLVQDSVNAQDKYWDAAIDDFRDNYYIDDDSGFFQDVGLRYMSDVADRFDVYWPYMTFEEGGGSQDIDSVADDLSDAIGMPVIASYSYHGATRKPGQFIIEPDGSLSPDSYEDGGLEIISPPMPIAQAMEKLNQVIEWAQAKGCYTNSSTGLHMGVSLPGQKSFAEAEGDDDTALDPADEKPIDFMKLALFLGDQYVLKEFGRQANNYCASSLKKMKERRWSPQQIATAMEKMRGNLINLAYKDLADRSPGRDSINMKDNYVEFRGAGGDYLSRESDEGMDFLENTLLRYVQALAIAGDPNAYRNEYAKKLYKLISPSGDDTLKLFSQFATGEISSEELKKDWAKRTLEKDEPSAVAKGNWVVVDNNTGKTVPGQEYSGYTEDEVYEKAKAKLGEYMTKTAFNMAYSIHPKETGRWEVYRDDHGQDETLEIIDADRKGEAVNIAADKYTGVIPFKVRAYYGDEEAKPEPTRRAKLAKNIIQQPAEEVKNWIVYDTVTGEEQYNQPGRKSNLVQAMRKMEQDNKWPRGRLALKLSDNQDVPPQEKEVKPNVAQNFTQQQGEQEVDGTGEPIWEIYEVGSGRVVQAFTAQDQREAAEHLQGQLDDWGTDDDVRELYAVRPKMQNAFERNSDRIDAIRGRTTTPPDATEQVGSWSLYDVTLNREISRLFDASWNEASERAEELERETGHNISVRGLNESVAEAQAWQGNRGADQAQTTDHTLQDATEYVKGNYPFAKKYRVRRAEPGFRSDLDPTEFNRSHAHVNDVDSAMDYLQLRENPMMSGSKQISSSLGYSWHTNENPGTGIAVLYYEDRGMGWDEIIVAAKNKNNLASAVQVFRDAGVIPTPKPRAAK